MDALAKETAENPNDKLLNDLRVLEKKMGLVLTLVSTLSPSFPKRRISLPDHLLHFPTPSFQSHSQFKASVWALITDQEAEEEQRLAEEERKRLEVIEREQEASRGGSSKGGGYAGDESF